MRPRFIHGLRLAGASLAWLLAGSALAQQPPPPGAPPPAMLQPSPPTAPPAPPPLLTPTLPPAPPPLDPGIAVWESRYLNARRALAEGRFDEARRDFDAIARQAPDPSMRAHAAELGSLSRYWLSQGLVLGPAAMFDLWAKAQETEKERPDQRSTDEIAVLYTNTAIWGMGFGITVGVASDGNAATYFLPGLAMVGVGAGSVAALDNVGGKKLRYGVAQSITAGLYIGFEAGMFAGLSADGVANRNSVSTGAVAGIMWGSATAGAITGGLIGHYRPTTPGRASFTESGAIWGGMVSSFLAAGLAADANDKLGESAPWLSGLVGTGLGAAAGGIFAGGVSPSIARVRFLDLGGLVGGLAAGGIYASVASSTGSHDIDQRAFFLLSSLGIVGGLGGTYFLTRNMEPDAPRRRSEDPSSTLGSMTPVLSPVKGGFSGGLRGVF